MRTLRALLLAALVLATPLAAAGDPEPLFWSPYNAVAPVNVVSLAAEGTTLAAGLGLQAAPNPGSISPTLPRVVTTDLGVLDLRMGWVLNGTDLDNRPEGRTHVAVSRDGSTVASIGNDTQPSASGPAIPDPTNPQPPAPGASEKQLRLFYARAPAGANFSSSSLENHSAWLSGSPVGLLVSADGRRVAVATNDAQGFLLRGFRLAGAELVKGFEYRGQGVAGGLAADGDLTRLYVGVTASGENVTRATVLLYGFEATMPSATWTDPDAGNTTLRGVAASRDGGLLAIANGQGRVHLVRPAANALPAPFQTLAFPDAASALAVSADGHRVSFSAGRTLVHADGNGTIRWRANLTNPANSLALDRAGGILVAGVPGEGLVGFGDLTADALWRNAGDARSVQIDARGEVVALARNGLVLALRLTHNLTLDHASGGDSAPARAVRAGDGATWELAVRNPGSSPERVRVETPTLNGVQLTVEPAETYVRPGQTVRVNVTARTDPAFTGGRVFNVTAVSLTSGLRDETTLALALQTAANVSLLLDARDLTVQPGEKTTLLLGIQNKGSKDAAVGIRARQSVSAGAPWDVVVDPPSLTLAANALTTVRVDATPPADAPNGTSLTLTLTLEGEDANDSVTVTLRINPSVGIEVRASPTIRFVQPGKAAHYNVTIKNTGSLPRLFEAYYDLLPVEGVAARSWAVDMQTREFTLDPGATRTVPVRIQAPADVTASDRVAVRISARMIPLNDTEAPVLGNVTLFANGEAPVPTPGTEEGQDTIPGAMPLLLPLAALAAALVMRRRRA